MPPTRPGASRRSLSHHGLGGSLREAVAVDQSLQWQLLIVASSSGDDSAAEPHNLPENTVKVSKSSPNSGQPQANANDDRLTPYNHESRGDGHGS
jgi:hypothetical protein